MHYIQTKSLFHDQAITIYNYTGPLLEFGLNYIIFIKALQNNHLNYYKD